MIESNSTNWKKVILFYVIACLISWPFLGWRDLFPESWNNWHFTFKNMVYMWGPGISALICFYVFRKSHVRTITFLGNNKIQSLLFYFSPYLVWLLILAIYPKGSKATINDILSLIPFGLLMILGEELGWRGFLQDALSNIKEYKRWIVLGLFWEMWHFTRGLIVGTEIQIIIRKAALIIMVLVLTTIIGKLTEKTKSLLIAVTMHSWVNIVAEFPYINTYITAGISVIIWTFLIFHWKKENKLV